LSGDRSGRRLGAIGGLALALLPVSGFAQPEEVPLQFHWDAPPSCPGEAAVLERIRILSGFRPRELAESRLRAEAHVDILRDRFRLTLALHYGPADGTRVIESSSCDDLGGAAAVALSLLVRVERSSGAPLTEGDLHGSPGDAPSSPAGPPPPVGPPGERMEEHARSPGPARAAPAAHWQAFVQGPTLSADVGVLPQLSYGIGLAAGLRYGSLRVAVAGTLWRSQAITTPDLPGPPGGEFERGTLALSGCRGWWLDRFELAPCLRLTLDDVTARGTGGQVVPRTTETYWLSVGGELAWFWHLSRSVALVLSADGRFATSRPRFVIDGLGEVYEVAPGAGGAVLGCEWIL
jgi:hypothetical protein